MPKIINPSTIVKNWLKEFGSALEKKDVQKTINLFGDECFWRDLVSFTWNIKTMEGKEQIADMLRANLAAIAPKNWKMEGKATATSDLIEAWFTFETMLAKGRGILRLKDGKAWTLLTTMSELKGHEEKTGKNRILGTKHNIYGQQKNWLERRHEEEASLGYTEQPYCVIIGGGQGGIALGARLKRLGVPTIILEKNPRAGDSWRNRYRSLVLHDPVWYDHLPYIPFPDDWPIFTPKDKLGDWLEMYTKVMELNYWGSTECKKASFDEATQEWTVEAIRDGKPVTLRPKQLVFATGAYGPPNEIELPGIENFGGEQYHSSKYQSGAKYKGKNCIVIGSNSSAHDICADLWDHGANVTMIQRSSTHVVKSETLMDLAFKDLYSEEAVQRGITTEKADLIFSSTPFAIMHRSQIPLYAEVRKRDRKFYDQLAKTGFKLDFGDDESGLMMKALRSGTGYYIDVGASSLMIEGKIGIKSGVTLKKINERNVVFSDNTEMPVDLIVCATGYQSMNGWVEKLVSKDMADKVGKCWGLGSNTPKDPGPWEGEPRNMWKPTRQPGLWFHGGNLHLSRHYSHFVALQLKARMENLPTPVYGLQKVHHLA